MTRTIARHAEPVARELLEHFPGLVIEGARQVGKSTLAGMLAADDAVLVNLDDEATLAAAQADLTGFVNQAGSRQLVIDEIQQLPELTRAVKSSIDADRRPGRFILTGSSSLLHVRGLSDSLAGRVARINLFGISRGEELGVLDDFIADFLRDPTKLLNASSTVSRSDYAHLLARGAYPEVLQMSPNIRNTWIDSYLSGILERDLPEIRRLVQPDRALAVMRTIAGRQSAELVKARLAQDTAIPARTVTGYLDLLQDVGLIAIIPPFTPNLAKREIGRPKAMILDSALAVRLARTTAEQLSQVSYSEAFGAMLESFVAAELLRQRTWAKQPFNLFHYRDSDGAEVDLVMELDDGSIIGVEVKAATSFSQKQFTGLTALRDGLGERFIAGIVLNTGNHGYRYADRLYGAPISALWDFGANRR